MNGIACKHESDQSEKEKKKEEEKKKERYWNTKGCLANHLVFSLSTSLVAAGGDEPYGQLDGQCKV